MGLRDFLMGAQQFSQSGQEFGQTANTIRQQVAQQDLAAAMPDLLGKLRTGSPEEQAQLAGEFGAKEMLAGVKSPYSEQIGKFALPAQGGGTLTADQLVSIHGLEPEKAASIASLKDPKAQQAALGYTQKKEIAQIRDESTQARSDRNYSLQERKFNYATGKDFSTGLQKTEEKFDDSTSRIRDSLAAFKKYPNSASLSQLVISIGKAAGNTGVFTDQDMNNFKLNSIGQKTSELESYYSNNPAAFADKTVQDELTKLAEFGLKSSEERKKTRLQNEFQNATTSVGQELVRGGKKTQGLINWEKKLGLEYNHDSESGTQTISKGTTEHTGNNQELINLASKIKDPSAKSSWIKYLNSKTDLTDEDIKKLKPKIESGKWGNK